MIQKDYNEICKKYATDIERYIKRKGIYNYFEENGIFNIEYRIDEQHRYKNVEVMIGAGGPNIYIDTRLKSVCLFWGNSTATYPLSINLCNTIDNYFENKLYEEI
jgi:hypothetical protein